MSTGPSPFVAMWHLGLAPAAGPLADWAEERLVGRDTDSDTDNVLNLSSTTHTSDIPVPQAAAPHRSTLPLG
jgi:hypothetical protein